MPTTTSPATQSHPIGRAERLRLAVEMRACRERLGMTQEDVANDIGAWQRNIGDIEATDGRDHRICTVQRHARGFDHAVRFRIFRLGLPRLPDHPGLEGADNDARHLADLLAQMTDVRRQAQPNRTAFADVMGIDRRGVLAIESARSRPYLSTYQRYVSALGGRLAIRLEPAPVVDEVAVQRALSGGMNFWSLSEAERWATMRRGSGFSNEELIRRLKVTDRTVRRLRTLVGQVAA